MPTVERCAVCAALLRHAPCPRCGGAVARADLLRPVRRGGFVAELVTGFRFALRGVTLTLSRPRLLTLVIVPLILNLAIFAGLVWAVISYRELLRPEFEGPWIRGFDWLRVAIEGAAVWLSVVIGVVLAAAGTFLLSAVVNAPFLEWLSETVESIVFDHSDETPITPHYVWNVWVVPVFQAIGLAVVQGLLAILLLALSLTGVLAPLVFVGGVWLAAITLVDIAIARKRFPVAARFRLVNRSFPLWFGLALPSALLPFLLPFAVAGATLAHLREEATRAGESRGEQERGR
ncbi:MAG: EI24 domain-containing protein [Planctomycetota bacterium JB042]